MDRKGLVGLGALEHKRVGNECKINGSRGWVGGKSMHYPTLETVMMVEETIKRIGPATLSQIHRATEKQVMWGTLKLIIDYLESRNMIATAKNGQIVWIYDPKGVKRYMKRKELWL